MATGTLANRCRAFLANQTNIGAILIHDMKLPDIVIVDYSPKYGRERVAMWRASFEQAVGLTSADVATGGRAAAQWDQISKGLLERAMKSMQLVR
jgi:hypothetical protein